MSSIGTGVSIAILYFTFFIQIFLIAGFLKLNLKILQYDLSASQFSPDGRVFQVEYAMKAVENSGTVIGLKGKDGVVLAAEKIIMSKLHEPGSNRRIFNVDQHIGMVKTTGFKTA